MQDNIQPLIEEYQCPGCTCGSNTKCGKFNEAIVSFGEHKAFYCTSHVPGTSLLTGSGMQRLILGLPKGFNRIGDGKITVRIHPEIPEPSHVWNNLNIPVWAMVDEGTLFVRTYAPRINATFVDVIPRATLDLVPKMTVPVDVGEFLDQID